jgi:hypothetical protein
MNELEDLLVIWAHMTPGQRAEVVAQTLLAAAVLLAAIVAMLCF